MPFPPEARAIAARIDGSRSLDAIRKDLPEKPDRAAFQKSFSAAFAALNGFSKLFLTQPG